MLCPWRVQSRETSDASRLSANIRNDFKPHFRSDLPKGSEVRFGVSGIWLCLFYKSGDKNMDLLPSPRCCSDRAQVQEYSSVSSSVTGSQPQRSFPRRQINPSGSCRWTRRHEGLRHIVNTHFGLDPVLVFILWSEWKRQSKHHQREMKEILRLCGNFFLSSAVFDMRPIL